jgi:hypothetical protein
VQLLMDAYTAKRYADAVGVCEECGSSNLTRESDVMGITARHTVQCDDCGWCIEFDGLLPPAY